MHSKTRSIQIFLVEFRPVAILFNKSKTSKRASKHVELKFIDVFKGFAFYLIHKLKG